jgi:epsilon-lactone hydrolase
VAVGSEARLKLALRLTARWPGPALPGARLRRQFAVSEQTMHGARTFCLAPRQPTGETRRLLYLHGGGHVQHMVPPQWWMLGRLVESSGRTAIAPHYHRAPAHHAPDILEQVVAIYADLRAQGGEIAIVGDSSGGGLALAVAMLLRDRGLPLPDRLLLICPWLDLQVSDPAMAAIVPEDPMLDLPGARAAGRWYAGDLPLDDPRVSPIFGDLAGLPPILMLAGSRDVLVVDARRLAAKAAAQGAALSFAEYAGMFHVWPAAPIPEGDRAMAEMAAFLRG